jgi:hypothetical protein
MHSRRRLRWRGWFALLPRLPGGPAPLAARGLLAVLARAGPGAAVVGARTDSEPVGAMVSGGPV